METKQKECKPKIVHVENLDLSVDSYPALGIHVYLHGVPKEKLEKISRMLNAPIKEAAGTVWVECAKARDGTKTIFVQGYP